MGNKSLQNVAKLFLKKYKPEQILWKILVEVFFGKIADPQPAILSKKLTPLQMSFY